LKKFQNILRNFPALIKIVAKTIVNKLFILLSQFCISFAFKTLKKKNVTAWMNTDLSKRETYYNQELFQATEI